MRTCPSCGFTNAEDATTCTLCGRTLAPAQPPEEPAPAAPPATIEQAHLLAPVTTLEQPPTMPSSQPPGTASPPYEAPPSPIQPGVPPPPPPLMMPRPQFTHAQWRNRYLLGLALGLIPVLIVVIFIGAVYSISVVGNAIWVPIIAALVLYLAAFIGMIVCLANDRLRPVGYGLLTMVVAGPVITVVSCFAIPALVRR